MNAMTQHDAFALGRSNLNGFLFANVGIEGSGMPLSVISALARQGFDPWQEAERLASLPRKVAADALARLIAAMPASAWTLPDAISIAARLVALLPEHDGGSSRPRSTGAPAGERSAHTWLMTAILAIGLLIAIAAFFAPAPAGPTAHLPINTTRLNSVPTQD